MPTWLFALVVLLFGVGLAFLVDRMKLWPRRGPYASRQRAERAKWLYYWFTGRFPSKEEEAADEAEAERLDAAERDAELKRKNRERKGE
ncbi:MAG: hypothetical protein AB7E46_06825 [Desulfovibrio sp.]